MISLPATEGYNNENKEKRILDDFNIDIEL